ncbi:hypothetical protein ACSHWO_28895 [Streptomyces sp. HUAS TT3]|uniref:hypothetical protein n=1 Tax=Streptomyces sp. HUAS TT3 TaxID=3447510 RepID=UPI003F659673
MEVELAPVPQEAAEELEEDGVLPVRDYLGGRPDHRYPDRAGCAAPWRFFFRLGDGDGGPHFLDFAHGGGYAYLSPARREGRFTREAA